MNTIKMNKKRTMTATPMEAKRRKQETVKKTVTVDEKKPATVDEKKPATVDEKPNTKKRTMVTAPTEAKRCKHEKLIVKKPAMVEEPTEESKANVKKRTMVTAPTEVKRRKHAKHIVKKPAVVEEPREESKADDLKEIKELNLKGKLTTQEELCYKIATMPGLEVLNLSHTTLTTLPEEVGNLTKLKMLNLAHTKIQSLPACICKLKNLEVLNLSNTKNLSALPEDIGNLINLATLNLSSSKVKTLPSSIVRLKNLQHLNLSWADNFTTLPEEIGDLFELKQLNLRATKIQSLPESIGNLGCLQRLDLVHSSLTSLPNSICGLKGLTHFLIGEYEKTSVAELRKNTKRTNKFLSQLVTSLPLLSDLGGAEDSLTYEDYQDFQKVVAENKFRARCASLFKVKENLVLWPEAMTHTMRTFKGDKTKHAYRRTFSQPTSTYQFLQYGKESFVKVLLQRNAKVKG